jgi:hypothetical protein
VYAVSTEHSANEPEAVRLATLIGLDCDGGPRLVDDVPSRDGRLPFDFDFDVVDIAPARCPTATSATSSSRTVTPTPSSTDPHVDALVASARRE